MATLAPSCASAILRLAESTGLCYVRRMDLYSFIQRLVIEGSRVELVDALKFIEYLTLESSDNDIGLKAYGLFHPGQLTSQMYSIMSSSTLGEALETVAHCSSLLSDGAPVLISTDAEGFSINFLQLESIGATRQYIDCCVSTMLGLVHWLLPVVKPMPVTVEFSYQAPNSLCRLESVFGSNLKFSQVINKMVFSVEDWTAQLVTANPVLKLHHQRFLEYELSKSTPSVSSCVRNHIFIGLVSDSKVSIESVARKFNISPRALRNRLEIEGTSFRDLVDECRRKLAMHLLSASTYSFAFISKRLGFSEPSSFHRACNRWFDCSAGSYRMRATLT